MRRTVDGPVYALLLAVATSAAPAEAQSVAEVVDDMVSAFERQTGGIENYTIVQTVMGFETVSYYVKEMVDGRPVFRLEEVEASTGGMSFGEDAGFAEMYAMGPDLVEHGRYGGRERIDGTQTHVILVDDLTQLDFAAPEAPDDVDFTPTTGRFYVDAERFVPRRIEVDGETRTDSGTNPLSLRMDLLDYRDVEGLLVPYRTVVTIDGMQAMMDPEMRAEFEEMQRELERMPAEQRAMMEQMLGGQLERMQEMMAGDGEPMVFELTVDEVRVNAGPPGQ